MAGYATLFNNNLASAEILHVSAIRKDGLKNSAKYFIVLNLVSILLLAITVWEVRLGRFGVPM